MINWEKSTGKVSDLRTIWRTFFVSGWWIHIIAFFCISLLLTWLHGRFWSRVLKRTLSPLSTFCVGAVSILSLEELFGWPIVAYRLPANWLLWITAAVLLLPPAAALLWKC